MAQFVGSIAQYPARVSFCWYIGTILLGSLVLTLPVCCGDGVACISWLDALFTSTSATCVTGLTVRSTGHDFSLIGQVVILLLLQLGGIGIMTVTTFVTFSWGRRGGLRERVLLASTIGAEGTHDLRWVLRHVIVTTISFESVGFVVLAARNLMHEPTGQALWHALFHSVSAFCNAGFSLFDDSLTRYQSDPIVNLTICALIISGGLGFPVMMDLKRNWNGPWSDRWRRLHLHSKLMLLGTAGLVTFGTISFLALDWHETLRDMSIGQRLLVAFFQSVTARTAGFNTIDIGLLTNASLFIMILLMMIGAGPCSTGGGFKVTTLMTVLVRAWKALRGFSQINLFRRTIPDSAVVRSLVTMLLYAVVLVVGLTMLLVLEQSAVPHPNTQGLFLDALFEVVSALGTVGLTTGMTPHLTVSGRLVIIVLMFVGRLGPISVFLALSHGSRSHPITLPQEEPLIG